MAAEYIRPYQRDTARELPFSRKRIENAVLPYEQDLHHFRFEYMLFPSTIATSIVDRQINQKSPTFPFYTPDFDKEWGRITHFMDDLVKQFMEEGNVKENPIFFNSPSRTIELKILQTGSIVRSERRHIIPELGELQVTPEPVGLSSFAITSWNALNPNHNSKEDPPIPKRLYRDDEDRGVWYINPLNGLVQPVIMPRVIQQLVASKLSVLVNQNRRPYSSEIPLNDIII